ncbi:hypothetical protein QVD17_01045 [Tagetes erecta]|uniref:Transposase n=1 Tax=Tagetes erecta TaxID=13708 RepID=A0AAD8L4A1_TARER|nr:hypothetical protein QVD17_01045 [Tagetes erecta]
MVLTGWYLRPTCERFDPNATYVAANDVAANTNISCSDKVPDMNLQLGIRALSTDLDVNSMLEYAPNFKIIELYIEHGVSRLNVYYKSPSKVKIVEPDVLAQSRLEKFKPNEHLYMDYNFEGLHNNGQKYDEMEEGLDPNVIQDKDNMVQHVHVDMGSFKVNNEGDKNDEQNNNGMDNIEGDFDDINDFDSGTDNEDMLVTAVNRLRKRKKKSKIFDALPFYVGQSFKDKQEIKSIVINHAVDTRRQLKVVKNTLVKFRAVCIGVNLDFVEGPNEGCGIQTTQSKDASTVEKGKHVERQDCPWSLHISRKDKKDLWVVKTFKSNHTCLQTREVNLYTVRSLAKEIEPIVESNPTIPLKVVQDLFQKKYQVHISIQKVYWLSTWKAVYQNAIKPINGREMWNPFECPTTLIPPKHHIQIGRPKKTRKKSAEELSQNISSGGKMTRKGKSVQCSLCKQKGHNKRGCKEKGASSSTQPANVV